VPAPPIEERAESGRGGDLTAKVRFTPRNGKEGVMNQAAAQPSGGNGKAIAIGIFAMFLGAVIWAITTAVTQHEFSLVAYGAVSGQPPYAPQQPYGRAPQAGQAYGGPLRRFSSGTVQGASMSAVTLASVPSMP
jgi:hypothetical protein